MFVWWSLIPFWIAGVIFPVKFRNFLDHTINLLYATFSIPLLCLTVAFLVAPGLSGLAC